MSPNQLIDRICDSFEAAWMEGKSPDIHEYVKMIEGEYRKRLLAALIPLDLTYRGQVGARVDSNDYVSLGNDAVLIAQCELDGKTHMELGITGSLSPSKVAESYQSIDNYKLLQKLGEGGMGEVWMADQERPVRRQVALKLIKSGLDNKQIIARFEAERQALAIMDHLNIAKVLDAGTTSMGAPYFVMELVRGIPFAKYCDQHKLSVDERLRLFVPVCHAIQHAHQKGIIHRDLKPSNVLVGLYDGQPVPKVIDFGLAKVLQQQSKLTDKTLFTEFGQVVGTIQYMSPEQAEMNQLDIDTRTDIYSLGVMLYEILIGSTPIEAEALRKYAILQVLTAIREQEPPRPSVRLSSVSPEAVGSISAQRQIEPSRLKQILKGELDWIVMKSIEKDRTRRYDTAIGLANDIGNYLQGDIVTARPPSLGYRFSKYVQRNKGLVSALSSIAALLILGIIGVGWFAITAEQSRKLADAVATELLAEKLRVDKERQRATDEAERATHEAERATIEAENARESERASEFALEKTEFTLARSNYFLALARWNEGRARDAQNLLQQIPEQHRNIEWFLDRRRFEGSDITLYGHCGSVECVAFSPDGTRIVSGSADMTIKLWDAEMGEQLRTLEGHSDAVTSVSFSADGTRIVSGSRDMTIKVWDAITGEQLRTLEGQSGAITSIAVSPDGAQIVSGSRDMTVKLWDAVTGEQMRTLVGHSGSVTSVSFSPDGTLIVSGSEDQTLNLWDAVTGQKLRTFRGHGYEVTSVAFSPDGMWIVSGDGSADDSKKITATIGAVSDKSKFITGNTLRLWDVATGQELRTLGRHFRYVRSVAFSSDGTRIASGSGDNTLKLWDAAKGKELLTLQGHASEVTALALSPDGRRIVSGSSDNTLKLWDISTAQDLRILARDVSRGFCFSPDGTQIVSAGPKGTLKILDSATGRHLKTLSGHYCNVANIAFNPNGTQIVSAGLLGKLKLWDTAKGQELQTFEGDSGTYSLAFSPDGRKVVSGDVSNRLHLWDAATGQKLRTLEGHSFLVTSVSFSPDGTLIVSGSGDKTLKLWDAATGQELRTLEGHSRGVKCVSFSPEGTLIVSGGSDKTLRLWNVASGKEIQTLNGHSDVVNSVAFSSDGTRIVSGSEDTTLKLWDAVTGVELRTLEVHSMVTCVALSPDGTRIVAVNEGGELIFWDSPRRQELRTLTGHDALVTQTFFNTTGTRIVSSSSDELGSNTNKFLLDAISGVKIREKEILDIFGLSGRSSDGPWLVVPMINDVGLVDLGYKYTRSEKSRRASAATPIHQWHKDQKEKAVQESNWFASTFNLAWLIKLRIASDSNPPDVLTYIRQLQDSYEKTNDVQRNSIRRLVEQTMALAKPTVDRYQKLIAVPEKHDNILLMLDLENGWKREVWQDAKAVDFAKFDDVESIECPYTPPDEYRMTAVVEPLDNETWLILRQRMRAHSFHVMLSNFRKDVLDMVDGTFAPGESTPSSPFFQKNKLSVVVVTVKNSAVHVEVNGQKVIDWIGEPTRILSKHTTPNLAIHSVGCRFRIHRLSIEPISGKGTRWYNQASASD